MRSFLKSPNIVNSLEILKFSLLQLPFSILTGEISLLFAKLSAIKTVSFVKNFFSLYEPAYYPHNHEALKPVGIYEYYINHFKESLVGGVTFYGLNSIFTPTLAVSYYQNYESFFGHFHPKLSGVYKSAFNIYDNSHTSAHIIDLLKTTYEVAFDVMSTEEATHDAIDHFNESFEFAYDYYKHIEILITGEQSNSVKEFLDIQE